MHPLADKRFVLGITGGIAAYKSIELARLLAKAGALRVQAVMTEAALHFVGSASFQAITGEPVFSDAWDPRIANGMAHIELSRAADAILIAPASADFLALLAQGRAPDLLSTLCLARNCPLAVAPAMNLQMWQHPATQRNVAQLRADGVTIFGPASGEQACGEIGDGRMLEPHELVEDLAAWLTPKKLHGVRAVVTAGPTFEAIDPVRGITNRSSGKMGYALARALRAAGAEVVLISGPTALEAPRGVHRVDVESARAMYAAVMDRLQPNGAPATSPPSAEAALSPDEKRRVDLFIGVAAVADWRPANPASGKLRKSEGTAAPKIECIANPDILAEVAALPNAPYCVGFAAETDDAPILDVATAKRVRKNVPLLIANHGPQTFGRDDNSLLLIDEHGSLELPRANKDELARALVEEIGQRWSRPRPTQSPA